MTEQIETQNPTPAQPAQPAKKGKKCKILRRTLCASSILFALVGAGVVGIIGSEVGTQWALEQAQNWVEGLQIGEVQGKLQNGLSLKNVQFNSAGVATQVAQADLQLDFSCLLKAKVCLENLQLQQAQIRVDTSQLPPSAPKEEKNTPMQRIDLPISVSVKNVALDKVDVQIDQNQIHLGQFHTALELNNAQGLTLAPTQIDDLYYALHSTNQVEQSSEPEPDPSEQKPVDWQAIEQTLSKPLLADLKEIILPFDLHLPDISGKNWQFEQFTDGKLSQKIDIPSVQIQADATDNQVKLQTLDIQSSVGNVQASGEMQLDQDFPLNLQLHSDIAAIQQAGKTLLPKSKLALNLSGSLKKSTALLLETEGAIQAKLSGEVQLNQPKTPFNLTLQSSQLRYPFEKAQDPLKLDNLDLNLSGNLLDYQAKLQGKVEGMGAPKTQLALQATGGLSHATIQQLQLDALKGKLDLNGDVDWKNGVQWQSAVNLNQINVGAYVPDFPAVLSGALQSSGSVNAEGWQVQVPQLDLKGSLHGRPLSLNGSLNSNTQNLLDTPQLQLNYGNNKIFAKGILAQQKSDFALDIQAPNLQGLVPHLSAALNGKAQIKGKISEPNLDLDLVGSAIRYQDLHINKVVAKGKITTNEQIQGDLNVDLSGFKQGDIQLQSAKLTASGNEKNHQLQLRSSGKPVAANLNIQGSFNRSSQLWQGSLSQVAIDTPIGEVKNSQNVQISFDNKQTLASISSHCWKHAEIDLCFPQNFKAGKSGEIPFELKRLNLELVNKLAEQKGLLQGQVRSSGKFAWFENKPPKLDLQLNSENIQLAQKIDYRTFRLSIPKVVLNAQLENNNLNAKSEILVQNNGRIQTDVKISDLANSRKLSGNLNIQGVNLALANQLLSNGEKVSGNIQSNLSFAGNLNAPLLNGALNINQLALKMKASPVEITGGNVGLNFHGNRSTLQGDIQTKDSRLSIDGDANWQDLARWNGRVHAKAEQFLVNVPSMAKVKVSPDVEVKVSPQLLDLKGNIDIPWARIAIESLPESAVTVSPDEVILDGKTAVKKIDLFAPKPMAATTKSGMAIQSDLKIKIGKDVTVSAYGLNSNLEGLLAVRQEKGKLGLYGQIDLKQGRYASFGQDLLIRKGKISFSGLPSQPLLNIEAIRNPEAMEDRNVTAGVKVTGIADAPNVEVFSEPSMPQDQALSYILTGRSLENSGDAGSSGSVGAALLGMGLAKSGKAVGKIGEAFGIQDLNLGTAGVGDSSKVVVSGNITPRLKIKYGVGLFDGLAEVTLRYRLLPQLFLQSVSGVNQAVDLLYEFEF